MLYIYINYIIECNMFDKSQVRPRTSQILSLELSRPSQASEWGLSLSGGWGAGQWLAVAGLRQGTPAHLAGLRLGDSLVQIQDQLVIFLDLQQVETILQTAGLSLSLTVER